MKQKIKLEFTMLALFVSHKSGEHHITMHPDIKHMKKELKDLLDVIHEDKEEYVAEARRADYKAVRELDGEHAEFADGTWYHYQEVKVSKEIKPKELPDLIKDVEKKIKKS